MHRHANTARHVVAATVATAVLFGVLASCNGDRTGAAVAPVETCVQAHEEYLVLWMPKIRFNEAEADSVLFQITLAGFRHLCETGTLLHGEEFVLETCLRRCDEKRQTAADRALVNKCRNACQAVARLWGEGEEGE